MTTNLEPDEQKILDSFEAGEWSSAPDREAVLSRHRAYAQATFRKDRRLNIRISRKDLEALQKRALEEGMPYQTLAASILHKYVSGRMRERETG